MRHIHHHHYIIPGLVDEAAVRKQAEQRAIDKRFPENSMIHHHKENVACDGSAPCYIITKERV